MNLLQIRQKFRDLSGRFDLVNEDGSDNGADFFINEGRKYLDRLEETQKSWGSVYKRLPLNHIGVAIPLCRAIKTVWATTSTARWRLDKKPLDYIMTNFLPESVQEPGTPLYYLSLIHI